MTIPELLRAYSRVAVIGLSSRPWRPSHGVAQYLQANGYQIVPVNPNEDEVLGEKAYPSLEDIPGPIEIVDVFRRSEFVPDLVDSAIAVGARVLWLQEGVVHPEAAETARAAGLDVVMDLCILKEHVGIGKV